MQPIYHLSKNGNRDYDLMVWPDRVDISGKFFYLVDKDFYKNKAERDSAFISDYLGMGYITKRSYKKTLYFVAVAFILSIVKYVYDFAAGILDDANKILVWLGRELDFPSFVNITMDVLVLICIVFGVILFFSKKSVVELSFTNKRICIPKKSLSRAEYNSLFQAIKSARTNIN